MESGPLIGAEVQHIRLAFAAVCGELEVALSALRELPTEGVGTPSIDPTVSTGVADLREALARLQSIAEQCVESAGRQCVESAGRQCVESAGGQTGEATPA